MRGRVTSLRCCFGLLLLVFTPSQAWATAPTELLEAAAQQRLAEHSYWLRLLHVPGAKIGVVSEVVSPKFFLAPQGAKDPSAELRATLDAFYEPPGDDVNQHAQCRFIARFHWLQRQLNFPLGLPQVVCTQFERWAGLAQLESLSIVFVSAYLDNPASFFGHLLLKVNLQRGLFAHPLLSPTLNFGANPDPDDNPFVYAAKGIFGGYTGRFSDERFYNFQHVYGENELRDLWEYPLNLTQAEQRRVLFHAWELLQDIRFRYFFFLENCAYRMAELLAMAWEEPVQLYSPSAWWAIPVDAFFALQERETVTREPVLGAPTLVPSRQRRLLWKAEGLTELQQQWVVYLQQFPQNLDALKRSGLEEEAQAQVLDALIDLLQYQRVREASLSETLQSFRQQVLLQRSTLPVISSPSLPQVADPLQGHPPLRTELGGFQRVNQQGLELGIRAAYHDLLDPPRGHLPHAELQSLDLRVRLDSEGWYFHKLTLFQIQNISLSPGRLDAVSGVSWRTSGDWGEESLDAPEHQVLRLTGGIGRSWGLTHKLVGFTFMDTALSSRRPAITATSLQLQPVAGLLWNPSERWAFRVQSAYRQPLLGESPLGNSQEWEGRWQASPDWTLRLRWLFQGNAQEASLQLQRFW